MLLEALAAGPMTAFELVRAAAAGGQDLFGGRTGLVFPVLLEMKRDGLVANEWRDVQGGRVNLWRRAADAPPADLPRELPISARRTPARIADVADETTRRLAFAPRLREELRADVAHLLCDAADEARARGARPAEAEKTAIRDLGDPWKIGIDLARTAQGRRTMMFSRGLGDTLAGIAIYDLRVLLVILAAIVFVRVQVITAYHIPTKSMEPTLHGDPRHGDRILVNKLAGPPGRFDITVFDGFGTDRKNFVKRCTGLPGEKLSLAEGDLFVDGNLVRKDGDAYEALLFEVFDRERERRRVPSKEEARVAGARGGAERVSESAFRERMQDLWRFEGDGDCGLQKDQAAPFAGFRLSAKDGDDVTAPGRRPPQLTWHGLVEDSYLDPETGDQRSGVYSVPDQRITFDVKPVPGSGARVLVAISRGEEHEYAAVLCGDGRGVALLADGAEVARDESVVLPEGKPTRVSFASVDRVLRLCVGGRLVLRHDLPQAEFPKRYAPAGAAMVRVLRGAAWIDPVRLERDVYYVPDGPEENFARLGPEQYFMMGDNSSNSSDSRTNGPVHGNRLVGSPLLVVWPPDRIHVPK